MRGPQTKAADLVSATNGINGAAVLDRVRAATGSPPGAKGFYLVAGMSMLVSIDTSWRFFGHVLHITNLWERVVMFAVLEAALIACGYGMRAGVQRSGHPGAPRLFAWLLCGLSGYMAWQLSGVAEGLARVALGPALGLVMLHLALGIEIRAGEHARMTMWARIGRELRERFLSRLGLADDERDALARTRDRAARRVARLSLAKHALFRSARVARSVARSDVAHDDTARTRMLAELAALRYAGELATLPQLSPWHQAHAVSALTTNGAAPPVVVDDSVTTPNGVPALLVVDNIGGTVTTNGETRAWPVGDTTGDTTGDTVSTANGNGRRQRPADRVAKPERRTPDKSRQSTAERVVKAVRRNPDTTPAAVAARLRVSERTVQRYWPLPVGDIVTTLNGDGS